MPTFHHGALSAVATSIGSAAARLAPLGKPGVLIAAVFGSTAVAERTLPLATLEVVAVAAFPIGQAGAMIIMSTKSLPVDTRGGVRLVRQRSGSPCAFGTTWGYDRNGVWVDRGCRADFMVGVR